MDQVQEIKNRLNIIDIIGEHVELKKKGRSYMACCPFHNEKTPSFTVSAERQLFYCFGCGTGGDVIKFIELIDRVDFQEALRTLADRAGVTLKQDNFGPKKEVKDRLREINQAAAEFFHSKLKENPTAKTYLADRGLNDTIITKFQLGYAPDDYHALHKHLARKGYSEKDILDAGLAISKGLGSKEIYDRFRDRIMFPITSARGDTIAFGGRAQKKSEKAKYLNSSDSPIYTKSEVLFGLAQARDAFRKKNQAVIVEGYFDMLSSYQSGVEQTVAPCGTSLTAEQLRELKRFVKNIVFALDTDEAGIEATRRAIILAQPLELELFVAQVPSGKDPDEFIQENPEEWKELITNPIPAWNFLKELTLEKYDPTTAQGKKQIISELSEYLKKTQSPLEQEHYLEDLARDLHTSADTLRSELKQHKTTRTKPAEKTDQSTKAPRYTSEDFLLGFIYLHPEWGIKLDTDLLPAGPLKKACIFAEKNYNSKVPNHKDNFFSEALDPSELDKAKILAFLVEEQYANLPPQLQENEFHKLASRVQQDHLKTELNKLKSDLHRATQNNDESEEKRLLQAIQDNLTQFKKLK